MDKLVAALYGAEIINPNTCREGAERIESLTAQADALAEALRAVIDYREGKGVYDLSRIKASERANMHFDMWQSIEDNIRQTLAAYEEGKG